MTRSEFNCLWSGHVWLDPESMDPGACPRCGRDLADADPDAGIVERWGDLLNEAGWPRLEALACDVSSSYLGWRRVPRFCRHVVISVFPIEIFRRLENRRSTITGLKASKYWAGDRQHKRFWKDAMLDGETLLDLFRGRYGYCCRQPRCYAALKANSMAELEKAKQRHELLAHGPASAPYTP